MNVSPAAGSCLFSEEKNLVVREKSPSFQRAAKVLPCAVMELFRVFSILAQLLYSYDSML